ncbi:MAG: HAMP domain-containing sensor histidine kinase, partial [Bacteroidota bacterium]|nr:HAMP domain-containing sensor histidine kinase [Bacteroidota bacterium]
LERLQLQEKLVMEKNEATRLRELSQMKSYFVSGVSHDLKTPLTSIKLFAELLEQQLPEDDTRALEYVSIMQGECDRLGRLINNVLDFTKIERGMMKYSFVPMDLNAVTRRAFDVMQYQFSMGGFVCELDCSETPLHVEADADALLEALTNLLSNAMKYSGTGRTIHLRTCVDNGHACIGVKDHGLGISQEDIAHLYEPFYRSRAGDIQKHGGVGLGLALVKHIVDAHGGSIDAISTPGEGSTFTISLRSLEAT